MCVCVCVCVCVVCFNFQSPLGDYTMLYTTAYILCTTCVQVIESCVEGMRKPECAIYQLALKRLGVEPREAVFLDDIGSNLKTASEMGISTIKVYTICTVLRTSALDGHYSFKHAYNTE